MHGCEFLRRTVLSPIHTEIRKKKRDYAETTMNELLGWYGYEKVVDRRDTQGLNLGHFAASSSDEEEDERCSGQDSAGEQRPRHHHHKQHKQRRSARLTPLHQQRLGTAVASSVGAASSDDALVIAAPQVGEPGTSPRDDASLESNGSSPGDTKQGSVPTREVEVSASFEPRCTRAPWKDRASTHP
ncbi:hypothetical protein HPB50_025371 [Hyalomma asiaticum]|uniref:Uncharacterized protein n=1 Tax=Hyalomma asiaticum TaxID=266040 RepID=A0ACB7S2S2_HYAAI|nr:hypothetical protein HPB50_025371 [Hyalomma asiaticum]